MKKYLVGWGCVFAFAFNVNAQVKIGENPDTIHPSAIFELESSNKGFLPPRINLLSLTDPLTIPSPAQSLLIFNTNTTLTPGGGYYYNAGTPFAPSWVKLVSARDSVLKSTPPSGEVIALSRFPMGELSMNGNSTITNITSANVWTKALGTTNFNSGSYQFSNGGINNRLIYTGDYMKMFHIACTISVMSTANGSNLKAVLYKNGVALTNGIVQTKMGSSSDIISTAIHVMTEMSKNDYLELWITNTISGADFTITEMNIFATGFSMGMD